MNQKMDKQYQKMKERKEVNAEIRSFITKKKILEREVKKKNRGIKEEEDKEEEDKIITKKENLIKKHVNMFHEQKLEKQSLEMLIYFISINDEYPKSI